MCEAGPPRLVMTPSRPLSIRHACHLDQTEAALWFSGVDNTALGSQTHQCDTDAQQSLETSYAEALWLGEHHTGLAHFLNCIDRLKVSHDLDDILLGLCQLIKSNSTIARRHRILARKLTSDSDNFDDLQEAELRNVSEYEVILAQRVVEVAAAGTRPTDMEALRERWISSMESRE